MSDENTARSVAVHIARLFEPLAEAIEDPDYLRAMLLRLGWEAESIPDEYGVVAEKILAAITKVEALALGAGFEQVADALKSVVAAYQEITSISTAPPGVDASAFLAEFAKRVTDLLVADYLAGELPVVFYILEAAGVIVRQPIAAAPGRPAFVRAIVDYEQVVRILTDPTSLPETVYRWGHDDFKFATAARHMLELLNALDFPASAGEVPEDVRRAYVPDRGATTSDMEWVARLHLLEDARDGQPVRAGVELVELPGTAALKPGIVIQPFFEGPLAFPLQLSEDVSLALRPGSDVGALFGILVRPEQPIAIQFPFSPDRPTPAEFGFRITFADDEPFVLLGKDGGTRLEVAGALLDLGASFAASSSDVSVGFEPTGMKLALVAAEGDGFVSSVLPADGLEANLAVGIQWSRSKGLSFSAGGSLEVRAHPNLAIGPARITEVLVALRGDRDQQGPIFLAEIGMSLSVLLGPIACALQDIGAQLKLGLRPGNAGPFDLQAGFKAPTGVGIAINAGAITGGGFISFQDGRYAGVLELKIYSVEVKAFGVIDTRMADGSAGFSFVIVISAEFTPIQLGLGFTLLGVGGLLGINRRLDGEALRNAVREGHLENVLFPKNLVARAPEVIRDLTAIFPATQDHYVFGPMAKIGWGTPTLIQADLGIILELPGPILSLLGEVHCVLPSRQAAIVQLHLSVAGQLDFARKSFELFAALHDSFIQGFKVDGQMAMRLRWGERPVFALAVGGFHPAFTPPPGFPPLQPMSVDLGRNGNPGILLTGFFAITSNSVQVGGALALRASGAGVTLEALLSVKAIFVFSPFSFEAEINAKVRVSFHGRGIGVHLHGVLSGPAPWRVRGEVCVSILWWDACLGFDKSFGTGRPAELPEIDPFSGLEPSPANPNDIPGLGDAIADPRSWEPVTQPGVFQVVSLAQAAGETPPFDPMGALSMRQRVVPLETAQKVTRFGVARAANPRSFTLTKATIGTTDTTVLARAGTFNDNFAPAQFFEMKTSDKLSAPSFEERVAGYAFAVNADDASVGSVGDAAIAYTTRVVDSRPAPPATPPPGLYGLPEGHLDGMLGRGAAGRLGLGRTGDLRYVDPARPDRFQLRTPKYLPTDRETLSPQTDLFAPTTKLDALLRLREHSDAAPVTLAPLQVVPEHEALVVPP
jgi:hypothetical protein